MMENGPAVAAPGGEWLLSGSTGPLLLPHVEIEHAQASLCLVFACTSGP